MTDLFHSWQRLEAFKVLPDKAKLECLTKLTDCYFTVFEREDFIDTTLLKMQTFCTVILHFNSKATTFWQSMQNWEYTSIKCNFSYYVQQTVSTHKKVSEKV